MFYLKLKKMKRLFVFLPAILLVLFLLNSFVRKDPSANAPVANATIVLKSIDSGQTWEAISTGLPSMFSEENSENIVESEGVRIATGQKGIRRSIDNGAHWEWVISEGGVGIAVERITGGFAAISYNTETKSRRIRISLDKGKTWQAIDKGLQPSMFVSSIKQMGSDLIVGHTDGIFRSSDMGKTWNRVHSGIDNKELKFVPAWNTASWFVPGFNTTSREPGKVFKIHASGNVLYAVEGSAGC
jgi:photosystem II stability/assembly factor-like uncharacterized protein